MALININGDIKLKKNSNVDGNGKAIPPNPTELEYGVLAINYNKSNPSLFFKDTDNKIVKITTQDDILNRLTNVENNKVDTVTGKGLSESNYTSAEKTKLSGIETGAQKNSITKVAGKTGDVVLIKSDVGLSNVDNTSDVNKPVSTAQQTELNTKFDKTGGLISGNVNVSGEINSNGVITSKSDIIAFSASENVFLNTESTGSVSLFSLDDVELPTTLTNNLVLAYDSNLGKWTAKSSEGTGSDKINYSSLYNIPSEFTPCEHNHESGTYVSDEKLKIGVKPITNSLDVILDLNSKLFGWSDEAKEKYNLNDEVSYGYIAQEVQKILPHIIKKINNGEEHIGIEYFKLIPFITESIKEVYMEMNEKYLEVYKENKLLIERITEIENKLKNL